MDEKNTVKSEVTAATARRRAPITLATAGRWPVQSGAFRHSGS